MFNKLKWFLRPMGDDCIAISPTVRVPGGTGIDRLSGLPFTEAVDKQIEDLGENWIGKRRSPKIKFGAPADEVLSKAVTDAFLGGPGADILLHQARRYRERGLGPVGREWWRHLTKTADGD